MSSDGPHENVLKFKPPLYFNLEDAKYLVEQIDKVMLELGV
jgi:4-aminobutyrate aminotransferase-like enzyme